jgi:hypothetical protein
VHWDICFVYDLEVKKMPQKNKPWWKELRLFPKKEIPRMKIGRGHLDILSEGRYLG